MPFYVLKLGHTFLTGCPTDSQEDPIAFSKPSCSSAYIIERVITVYVNRSSGSQKRKEVTFGLSPGYALSNLALRIRQIRSSIAASLLFACSSCQAIGLSSESLK